MEFAILPLEKIETGSGQSRQHFKEESLEKLSRSIQEVGQLQPVIVLPREDGESYLLIAGERRYRALLRDDSSSDIAALILDKDLESDKLWQINLVENLQREDLDALERARAISRYIESNNYSISRASQQLGLARTTLTKWLLILEIPKKFQQAVLDEDSALTLSHVSIARGLANRTGNEQLSRELMQSVLQFNLTRQECIGIRNLYKKYLHLEMAEAVGAVLLKRGRQQAASGLEKLVNEEKRQQPVKKLLKSFSRAGENLESYLNEIGYLDQAEGERLKTEFIFIYQLLKIMLPELQEKSLEELIAEEKKASSSSR